MDGVRETICTKCSHRDVCMYKDTYLHILSEIEKVFSENPEDHSFMEFNDPGCKFVFKKPTFTAKSNEDINASFSPQQSIIKNPDDILGRHQSHAANVIEGNPYQEVSK